MSRTIELDDLIVDKTIRETGASTDKAAVEEALALWLQIRGQAGIRELRGKVQWEGDLNESRLGRFEDR